MCSMCLCLCHGYWSFPFLLLAKQLALTVLTHHGSAVGAGNIGVSFRFSNLFFNNGFYRKFSRAYFTAGGRRRNVTLPVVWLFLILRSLLAPLARAVCRHFFRSIHTHSHTCLLTRGGCWWWSKTKLMTLAEDLDESDKSNRFGSIYYHHTVFGIFISIYFLKNF